jgi:ribosome-binding factor A
MSKRLLRVSELLKRELGTYISKEVDFQNVLVSVHDVEVAPNLKTARVFIGVIGDQNAMTNVIGKLNHQRVAMQAYIGKRVTMKFTPRLEFLTDDSIERGVRVLSLLEDIADEEAALPDKKNEAAEESDERQ